MTDHTCHGSDAAGPGRPAAREGAVSDYTTEIPATLHHDEGWPCAPAEHLRSAVVVESGEWGDGPAVRVEVTHLGDGASVYVPPGGGE